MNLVIISLKMVYSFNPFMSLNICVNFIDLNCQLYPAHGRVGRVTDC